MKRAQLWISCIVQPVFLVSLYVSAVACSQSVGESFSSLPRAEQSSIAAALGSKIPDYRVRKGQDRLEATNPNQELVAYFTGQGVEIRSGDGSWRMALRGYGYGNALVAARPALVHTDLNRVEYRRGSLTEWYVNGPLGLEQGFTISERPGEQFGRPLTICLALSQPLTARIDQNRTGLTLIDTKGKPALFYGGLTAYDASGKELTAWLELKGARLLLNVDDAEARYPLVIDPYVQSKLSVTGYKSLAGSSVALEANTLVVGAPSISSADGAAYIFQNTQNNWSTAALVATLTPSDATAGDQFGASVAIAEDIIVVGKPTTSAGLGAAYIYGKPKPGWKDARQNAKLTPSDGQTGDAFGASVAISEDSKTIVVGAPQVQSTPPAPGAVYVFTKPAGGPWKTSTQTAELTSSTGVAGDALGTSVAISGNTILAGAPGAGTLEGTAYVFTQPVGGWTNMTETAQLSPSNPGGKDQFGSAVALAGGVAVVGAPNYNSIGAALIYVEPGTGWANTTQSATLSPLLGAYRAFGSAVAINSSANTTVVGGPHTSFGANLSEGAAHLFREPTGGWTGDLNPSANLVASDGTKGNYFGTSVAISGNTVAVGSPYTPTSGANSDEGAVYVFSQAP